MKQLYNSYMRNGEVRSDYLSPVCGVPQGDVLSSHCLNPHVNNFAEMTLFDVHISFSLN